MGSTMNSNKTIRKLPSTAWQALKDYFAGLGLFFNRENWSHSVVFILTLGLFVIAALLQQPLRLIFIDPISGVNPALVNSMQVAFIAGCGAFIGFLLLGLIALIPTGRRLMFESRFRHLVSPIVIVVSILLFIFAIPPILRQFPNLWDLILGRDGIFPIVFRASWMLIIFLQVILMGYTVVKAIKWLAEYFGVPVDNPKGSHYWILLAFSILLIPFLIWVWNPVVFTIMIDGHRAHPNSPTIPLEWFILWLLSVSPGEYVVYLWLVFPFVAIIAAIVLWRRLPSVSVALSAFGMLYPAFVYYYRFRVIQYFINWSWITYTGVVLPFRNYGLFQIFLLLLTFILVLLGAAKLQRNVSPNPFPLFAIMVGTVAFALSWALIPDYSILFGMEYLGMYTAALSAFLALFVFLILPIAYGIYRMRQFPAVSPDEKATELELFQEDWEESVGEE
jgi:hypothetical protein